MEHRDVFTWVLERLALAGLVKGKTVGIDATVLEANAALWSIVHRETGESYQEFLTKLAEAPGIKTPTRAALARLDRKRKKKGSTRDWKNPLLLNAEHAMTSSAEQDRITIETSGNGQVQTVEVTDSGPGIRPELRGRIFEPFFTTRDVGEGTGLGLSISHGIASSHGRTLTLVDSASGGAKFRLTLPAQIDALMGQGVPGSGVRALVVDDDEPIRKLIVKLLEKRGYEVAEAETGESGLPLALDRRPGIVICDTSVRGMTGFDLYRQLAARNGHGAPRFLFISGD